MKTDTLQEVLKRVEGWLKEAQAEAIEVLREIEEDFVLGPETLRDLDGARAQARRGKGAAQEEVFGQHGL